MDTLRSACIATHRDVCNRTRHESLTNKSAGCRPIGLLCLEKLWTAACGYNYVSSRPPHSYSTARADIGLHQYHEPLPDPARNVSMRAPTKAEPRVDLSQFV